MTTAASNYRVSNSVTLTPEYKATKAGKPKGSEAPNLTELRRKLLEPDAKSVQQLERQYAHEKFGEAHEAISRELAARVVIQDIHGEFASEEKEFVLLQLLIGDADAYDDQSIQEVARKLAGLSVTLDRHGTPMADNRQASLLTHLATDYASHLKTQRAGDLGTACQTFRKQVSDLASKQSGQLDPSAVVAIVEAFDQAVTAEAVVNPAPQPVVENQPPPMKAPPQASPVPVSRAAPEPAPAHRNPALAVVLQAIRSTPAPQPGPCIDLVADSIAHTAVQWSGQDFAQVCSQLVAKFGGQAVESRLPAALLRTTPEHLMPTGERSPTREQQAAAASGCRRAAGLALSLVIARQGISLQAVKDFTEAVLTQPKDGGFSQRLIHHLAELGQFSGAINNPVGVTAKAYLALYLSENLHELPEAANIERQAMDSFKYGTTRLHRHAEHQKVLDDARKIARALGAHAASRAKPEEPVAAESAAPSIGQQAHAVRDTKHVTQQPVAKTVIPRDIDAIAAMKVFAADGPTVKRRSPEEFEAYRDSLLAHVKSQGDQAVADAINFLRLDLPAKQRAQFERADIESLISNLQNVFCTPVAPPPPPLQPALATVLGLAARAEFPAPGSELSAAQSSALDAARGILDYAAFDTHSRTEREAFYQGLTDQFGANFLGWLIHEPRKTFPAGLISFQKALASRNAG